MRLGLAESLHHAPADNKKGAENLKGFSVFGWYTAIVRKTGNPSRAVSPFPPVSPSLPDHR